MGGKKGFTLIEMLVVMGILAVLSLLGVGGLIALRNQNAPELAAQDFLSNLREAQNRAFLVMNDSNSNPTKVWAIGLNPASDATSYTLNSLFANGAILSNNTEKTFNTENVSISILKNDSSYTGGKLFVTYSSPFSKSYILNSKDCTLLADNCEWRESARPSKEWEPGVGTITYSSADKNSNDKYQINFTRNNVTRSVVIYSNGDAYVQ